MNIAISQRIIVNKNGDQVDSLEQSYIRYYQSFGVTVIPIPNILKNIPNYFRNLKIERIIFSGGGDVDPKLFGGKLNKKGSYSPQRDQNEIQILNFAKTNQIPVLGICRGTQFLNVSFGGKLIQDLKKDFPNSQNHVATNHQIKLIDPIIQKAFTEEKFHVNSYHNCGLGSKELSSELNAFAKSDDDLIEGIYHPNLPIAGIMWHPERKSPNESFNLTIVTAFLKRGLYWKKTLS
ncbi:MAG: gamma-glutamyl-gamma-aminobutyrate hydrolase family protein [Actinobacteria bacterium]|nr:gamma-glutamyl-gamma-aminobutyrate hydrolase family protein [Actinomycetota bacterium]